MNTPKNTATIMSGKRTNVLMANQGVPDIPMIITKNPRDAHSDGVFAAHPFARLRVGLVAEHLHDTLVSSHLAPFPLASPLW